MRPLMVLGCTSNAGKSLLVTALVRSFARRGVDVVPFKAQNMSNNARVVAGGEIGVAQWLQARAAGVEPDVRMNPVLLKPEADTRSQVVVDGVARPDLTAMPWRDRGPYLWPAMAAAFDGLRREHELVIIEGAGSPAEINLPDLVNNRVLAHADATALLVADIDRGGAFAHLYGTWALVPDATRQRLAGFVLNRFRGDAALLEPGPSQLTGRTGMAHAGTLPMLHHELPDEEGATVRACARRARPRTSPSSAYPYASNLDELHLLAHVAHVRFAHRPADLAGADMVRPARLQARRRRHRLAARQRPRRRRRATTPPPGAGCSACAAARCSSGTASTTRQASRARPTGSGCSPFDTVMHPTKLTRPTTVALPRPAGAVGARSTASPSPATRSATAGSRQLTATDADGALQVVADGTVLATTVHGLLEDPAVLAALFGARPSGVLDATFDLLADAVDAHLDRGLLDRLVAIVIPDGVAAAAAVALDRLVGEPPAALAPRRLVRHRHGAPRAAHLPRRPHRRDPPPRRRRRHRCRRRRAACGACSGGPTATLVATTIAVAGRMLADEADAVLRPLATGDLDAARARLAGLVGRDVTRLDRAGIVRAVIETVAENTVDAVTAPLWWAAVGGAPAVLAHRADQHARRHGRPPQRALPAVRLGVGSRRRRRQLDPGPPHRARRHGGRARVAPRRSRATVRRDAPRHPSPNGGVVEAAFAAALDVRLGGTNTYGDVVEDRGTLGDGRPPTPADGVAAIRLARVATAVLAGAVAIGSIMVQRRGVPHGVGAALGCVVMAPTSSRRCSTRRRMSSLMRRTAATSRPAGSSRSQSSYRLPG